MIHWKPEHTGVLTTTLLAGSIVLFYLAIVLPVPIPGIVVAIFYLVPGALIAASIDHGHANSPWRTRWHRLALSWLAILAWFLVGSELPQLIYSETLGIGRTAGDIWSFLWPLMLAAAVIALIGIWLVRAIERRGMRRVIDVKPKKRLNK